MEELLLKMGITQIQLDQLIFAEQITPEELLDLDYMEDRIDLWLENGMFIF